LESEPDLVKLADCYDQQHMYNSVVHPGLDIVVIMKATSQYQCKAASEIQVRYQEENRIEIRSPGGIKLIVVSGPTAHFLSSTVSFDVPFVCTALMSLSRVASVLILHHTDVALPCADFCNPG
jgi:hypothetical protein